MVALPSTWTKVISSPFSSLLYGMPAYPRFPLTQSVFPTFTSAYPSSLNHGHLCTPLSLLCVFTVSFIIQLFVYLCYRSVHPSNSSVPFSLVIYHLSVHLYYLSSPSPSLVLSLSSIYPHISLVSLIDPPVHLPVYRPSACLSCYLAPCMFLWACSPADQQESAPLAESQATQAGPPCLPYVHGFSIRAPESME